VSKETYYMGFLGFVCVCLGRISLG
jgi:hypothetical protein